MPSLGGHFACQASADTLIILCKEQGLRLWRCSATESISCRWGPSALTRCRISCRWGPSYEGPAQSAVSSICEICSAPRWSWESSSTWKPSRHHRVASIADSRRAERGLLRWVFIVAGLAASRVQHCWLQPCSRQDHLRLGCSEAEARAGNQSWEREEETASDGSCPRVAPAEFEDLLNSLVCWWLKLIGFEIYSTHWSC